MRTRLASTLLWMILVLIAGTGSCLALMGIAQVTTEEAKKLGMKVRAMDAGPVDVRVELEFEATGVLRGFSRVELRVAGDEQTLVRAQLKEERSATGKVQVSFAADRSQLHRFELWVTVRDGLGGTAYQLRVMDFVH